MTEFLGSLPSKEKDLGRLKGSRDDNGCKGVLCSRFVILDSSPISLGGFVLSINSLSYDRTLTSLTSFKRHRCFLFVTARRTLCSLFLRD